MISRKNIIILEALVLCVIALSFASVTHNSSTICDGVQYKEDPLDDSFERCYSNMCNETTHFRCLYGGCIPISNICNNKNDCWDGSDENELLCLEDEDLDAKYEDIHGDCESNFDCKDKGALVGDRCITWDRVCDGKSDCTDNRDESTSICAMIPCAPPNFRCKYGACISQNAMCNHVIDCFDSSDELLEICLHPSAYVDVATSLNHSSSDEITTFQGRQKWTVNECVLNDPKMVGEDFLSGITYLGGDGKVPDKNHVVLRCAEGYSLDGEKYNICDGDKWLNKLGRCVQQCKHFGNNEHSTQCFHNNILVDCEQQYLLKDTEMKVTCAPGYIDEAYGTQVCGDGGEWKVKKALPKCKPMCGFKVIEDCPDPWEMSVFQRGHKPIFQFACTATVVSPFFLLAPSSCFQNITIKSVKSREPVLYTVAEGERYTETFNAHELHAYKLHNVSFIQNVTQEYEGIFYPLVLVQLMQPLEIGANLNPVCLSDNDPPEKWLTRGDFKENVGKAICKKKNDLYVLEEYIGSGSAKYDISAFMRPIKDYI
ncbi:modular serine protease isoform X2 [Drosophila ananassae]|uniref:modular serine protease isoform X2 n=1 Tax=Drosophila ananassae TaxID=7217 RepID=UPI001CFF681B|nr:modular serine protease isoform X2 [Drosophila ananassae]